MRYASAQHPTFLLTRPAGQGENLRAQLEALGAQCLLFPTLVIEPQLAPSLTAIMADIHQMHHIIFTSANAVYPVMPFWPSNMPQIQLFAIGPGTAKALADFQLTAQMPLNNQFNSEGLLALPQLQNVAQQKVIIFTGQDGRNLLATTLKQRQAIVQELAVYRRACPKVDIKPYIQEGQQRPITAIISTSSESLRNLWALAEAHQAWLCQQRLIVISPTMAALAKQLGFLQEIFVAENPSDTALLKVICQLI